MILKTDSGLQQLYICRRCYYAIAYNNATAIDKLTCLCAWCKSKQRKREFSKSK